MTFAIQTKGLTKSFGDFTAVNGIDLEVKQGTINGFIGPNGAGKSTTMKMLIGALLPSKGTGFVHGHPIGSIESKNYIGFSPEHPKFYEDMTAEKYLTYMGMICGMCRSDAEQRSNELLRWLEIHQFSQKQIYGFSAGMRQKLSLAQSLIHNPELLILDEPTANLDPAGRVSIIKKLKELSKENQTTVFISSHVLGELEKLVTEVTMINHGTLVARKDVSSLEKEVSGNQFILKTSDNKKILPLLTTNAFVESVNLDENNIIHLTSKGDQDVFRKNISQILLQNDVWIELFNIETAGLENLFMKLVGEGEEEQRVKPQKHEGLLRRIVK